MLDVLSYSLKQAVQAAHPRTVRAFHGAGMFSPRSPLGLAASLPWLLGRGPSLGIVSQMNAIVLGHKPALHDADGTLSFRELEQTSNATAHLYKDIGLRGRDKVGTLLRNGRDQVNALLGAQKVGVVACPFNTWAKPKELKAILEQAEPKALIYDTRHAEQLEGCDLSRVRLLHVGDDVDALPGSENLRTLAAPMPKAPVAPVTLDRGAPKIVIHTSGTTGTPKGAQRGADQMGIGDLANLLSVVPYRRDDVVFCPAPMFHSLGLATLTFSCILGATVVLPEKFDPEQSLSLIEEYNATAATFVPVMIKRIVTLDDEVKGRHDVSSLRIVLASGSAMSPDLRKAAMELFGEVLYDLYGSTEIAWVAIATPQAMSAKPKTVGKPVPGVDVAVYSKDGDKAPSGETGELFVKSEALFEGYTSGDSKDTRDGYMSIGDLGHLDEEGYLYIDGRADDMVVIGGENVYPIEVEEVIESIDGVSEAAVLGVEDEEMGQVLAAFVAGSVGEAEITQVCKKELASYKVPRRIEILDSLPRTSTGKILKRELIGTMEGAEEL